MFRKMLKSKIQYARITFKNLKYTGSITIDRALMDKADLYANEMVMLANLNNGARLETYVIPGDAGSGSIELNGATARLGQAGDRMIIFAFARVPESDANAYSPRIVQLDDDNRVIRRNFADAA